MLAPETACSILYTEEREDPAKTVPMSVIKTRGHQLFPVLDGMQIDTAKRLQDVEKPIRSLA